tara:strand:+ start:334 stop:666 length:333 start_codon:yes stop_codon:yes gene_type:complete
MAVNFLHKLPQTYSINGIQYNTRTNKVVKQETKELNPYIGPFLRMNGFSSAIENRYSTLVCTITVHDNYYEIQFNEPEVGEVAMYTDSWSIPHLVGLLTWHDLIDRNYKK